MATDEPLSIDDIDLSPPVGASLWDRELFAYLTEHVVRESTMLKEYRATAEATGSKAFEYLVGLLMDDEVRHHRLFVELAASLKSEAELRVENPVVPRMDLDRVDRDALLEPTNRLLDDEKSDLAELKRLRKDLRDVKDVTLWALLVDIMIRDTEKHIAILEFVKRHAKPKR